MKRLKDIWHRIDWKVLGDWAMLTGFLLALMTVAHFISQLIKGNPDA